MHWFTESLYDAAAETIDPNGQECEGVEYKHSSASDIEQFVAEFADGTKRLVTIQEVK